MAGLHRRKGRARSLPRAAHHVEHDPLRIRDHREAADAGNVGRRHLLSAARLNDLGHCRGDIAHPDIAQPTRPHTPAGSVSRDRHEPGDIRAADPEDPVAAVGGVGSPGPPADGRAIKTSGGISIGRQQLIPDEIAMLIGHGTPLRRRGSARSRRRSCACRRTASARPSPSCADLPSSSCSRRRGPPLTGIRSS